MSFKSFTAKLSATALLVTTLALPGYAAVADDAVALPAPMLSDYTPIPTVLFTEGAAIPEGMKYHWFYRAGRYVSPVSAGTLPTLAEPDTANWDAVIACVSLELPGEAVQSKCSGELPFSGGPDRFSAQSSMNYMNQVGSTLVVTLPKFVDPSAARYEWRRSQKPIPGATAARYTLAAEDIGHRITVRVKYAHPFGLHGNGTNQSDYVNVRPGRMNAGWPTLSGKAAVGSKASVTPGTWTSGTTFTYQWLRNGLPISGATKSTYTLTSADIAQYVGVEVTGSQPGFNTVTRSALSEISIPALKLASSAPKLSGTAQVGKKLTVTPGKWTDGTKLQYQWLTTGKQSGSTKLIKGATSRTYTVQPRDVGRFVWASVTGSKTNYETKSLGTNASQWVIKGKLKAGTPKVSGTAKPGKPLAAKPGTWTEGTKLKYQWLCNGATIKNATKSTYKVSSKDAAKKISVKVTGTKSGYTTRSITSKSTAKVRR